MSSKRILIIAQTPPPFHGQSIMQKYLADADWNWAEKDLARMNFSDEINEVGKFKIKKVFELFRLIRLIKKKAKSKFELIYYPPAGPKRIPIYRDIILLFILKRISSKVVLHFHAGGIDQIFKKVSKIESYFIRRAFNGVSAAIVCTEWLKKEVEWCRAKKIFVVGYGVKDVFEDFPAKVKLAKPVCFLFAGNLKKEKGVFTLLKAALILKNLNRRFEIRFIGSFHSDQERQFFFAYIDNNELGNHVKYLGTKSGDKKWEEFQNADALCLPTFETEAMPVSIIEAMMYQMPVVTTNWRSIPDLIKHGENGLLFEPENEIQLSKCMDFLISSQEAITRMGLQARKDYLENFTVAQYLKKMEAVFADLLVN